jgi:transcription initiation factor TFIID subunit 11
MALAVVARTKESQRKENQDRAMLVGALDSEQMARYEIWRSSKLSDAVVRRLVNQTLSQSAPANVILAVKSVAKIFAGEIIERARRIQTQALAAEGVLEKEVEEEVDGEKKKVVKVETRRGPLLPHHLREALRRYTKERDGNGVGLTGFWQLQQHHSGVERFGMRVGGKRLLK